MPIGALTRSCAVFGHPINHSASPAMQNAGIAALGLNWRYLAFDVHPDRLATAIAGAREMKFIGLNLTIPHKLLALKMVDELDESARKWRAVNTISFETKNKKGRWISVAAVPPDEIHEIRSRGFNTDADAITRSLHEDLEIKLRGAKVLVLGAGGAGKTAALKLAAAGLAELFLVNRTRAKAEGVAREIRKRFPKVKLSLDYPKTEDDLLLNATSLGLRPRDPMPVDARQFSWHQTRAVYDMIYRPAETPLLKAAHAHGCRTANGLGMLLYQGAKALEIWSGKKAPIEIMRAALKENIYG